MQGYEVFIPQILRDAFVAHDLDEAEFAFDGVRQPAVHVYVRPFRLFYGSVDGRIRKGELTEAFQTVRKSCFGKGGAVVETFVADAFQPFGQSNALQSGASEERFLAEGSERSGIGKLHLREVGAVAESGDADGLDRSADRDALQPRAAEKRHFAHRRHCIGNVKFRQRAAAVERVVLNGSDVLRDGEIGQGAAIGEQRVRKDGDAFGDDDVVELIAGLERRFADGNDRFRDLDVLHLRTAVKGVVADGRDVVADGDARHAAAAERGVPDGHHGLAAVGIAHVHVARCGAVAGERVRHAVRRFLIETAVFVISVEIDGVRPGGIGISVVADGLDPDLVVAHLQRFQRVVGAARHFFVRFARRIGDGNGIPAGIFHVFPRHSVRIVYDDVLGSFQLLLGTRRRIGGDEHEQQRQKHGR